MQPGTTSSEAPRLAPRRFPGPALAPLARVSVACAAVREGVRGVRRKWMGRGGRRKGRMGGCRARGGIVLVGVGGENWLEEEGSVEG